MRWREKSRRSRRSAHRSAIRRCHELEREQGKPSLVELGVEFCRELRAKGNPAKGQPVDKAFRDSLYETVMFIDASALTRF